MEFVLTLLGVMFVTGCQAMDPLSGAGDPHARWWELGFSAPPYMTVWVETAAVEDVHGKLIERVNSGGGVHFPARGRDGVRTGLEAGGCRRYACDRRGIAASGIRPLAVDSGSADVPRLGGHTGPSSTGDARLDSPALP